MSHCHSEMKKEFDEEIMPSFRLTDDTAKEQCIRAIYESNRCIEDKPNKYQRQVKSTTIDVYDVLKAFEVNNPATAHAVKKLLASGQRGYKDVTQDLQEAMHSIERAIELESGD